MMDRSVQGMQVNVRNCIICFTLQDPNGKVLEEDFDSVILAIGHNSVPNFPTGEEEWWPNQNRFEGRLMHSKDYKHGGAFEDKICVVVGSGNSAVDVASDLGRVAKKVAVQMISALEKFHEFRCTCRFAKVRT